MFQKLRAVLFLCVVCVSLNVSAKSTLHKPWGMGKGYWLAFPKPGWASIVPGALVSSPLRQTLSITAPGSKESGIQINTPNTLKYIGGTFNVEHVPDHIDKGGATHIQGEQEFSLIGQMGDQATKGTLLALPVTAWGTEYYVLGLPENLNDGNPRFYSVPGITIIAQ